MWMSAERQRGAHPYESCCAKSGASITTWVGIMSQILRLRYAPRRMTVEVGAAQDDKRMDQPQWIECNFV